MEKRKVKFYWWRSVKVLTIKGKDLDEIVKKCHWLCDEYHAVHFEVLSWWE